MHLHTHPVHVFHVIAVNPATHKMFVRNTLLNLKFLLEMLKLGKLSIIEGHIISTISCCLGSRCPLDLNIDFFFLLLSGTNDQTTEQNKASSTDEMPVPKIKHDWYQTETHVVITILIKNQKAENVKVDFTDKTVNFYSIFLF